MAKLSQQIEQKQEPTRPTRTQRVLAQQKYEAQQRRQRKIQEAKKKLEDADYETYESTYYSIDPDIRKNFMSPSDLKKTEGYQKYQRQKQQLEEVKKFISISSKADRGKPFWGWGKSKAFLQEVGRYREGVGSGSKIAKRTAYLKQKYPELPESIIEQAVQQGTVRHFGTSKQFYGMDVGETIKITTKDKETGKIKEVKTYKKTSPSTISYEKLDYEKARKEQQKALEEAYKDVSKPEKAYFDFKEVERPSYFAGKETVGGKTTGTVFAPITLSEQKEDTNIFQKAGKFISKKTGDIKIPLIGLGGSIKVRDITDPLKSNIDKKTQELFLKEITRTGLKEDVDERFGEEYETRFYKSDIGRKAFFGEVDFEEAKTEFAESKEAKIIEKKYGIAIEEGRKGKFTKEGFGIAGLGIAKTGVSLIPETYGELAVESAVAYGGIKGLKSIPTYVLNIGAGEIGVVGVSKAISKEASPEEKARGVITAGLSFGVLGVQGVRYLRQPTVKTVKIPSPKQELRATSTIGKDVKIINPDGSISNKILFGNQKLSQIGVGGRRTVVSTRWRDILKLDPIYRGVPYSQRGVTYSLKGLRGTYSFSTPSAYEKAFKLLTKRGGYTPYKASQKLRYIQPQLIKEYLSKGSLAVKGGKAVGRFEYLTKQPTIVVDKALGIKTRGARTIKDVYQVERKLVNIKGGTGVLENQLRTSFYLKRGASPFAFKDFQYSKGLIFGRTSGARKGLLKLKTNIRGLSAYEKITYKDLTGVSFRRGFLPSEKVLNVDVSRTQLIDKLVDLSRKNRFVKTGTKRTPLSKTFGTDQSNVKFVKDTIKKLDKNIPSLVTSQRVSSEVLKQSVTPQQVRTSTKIKNLLRTGQSTSTMARSGIIASTFSLSAQRIAPKLKTELNAKNLLKEELMLKQQTQQTTKVATVPVTKLQTSLIQPSIIEPFPISTPRTPRPVFEPRTPVTPPIPILFPFERQRRKLKVKTRGIQDYTYLPDFTARAIGLKAETVSEKQAKKKLKQLMTGFEIRRGVKIQ